MSESRPIVHFRQLGHAEYRSAWQTQAELHAKVVAGGEDAGWMLFCEHPPVFTLGRQTKREHLLRSGAEYADLGAEVVEIDRGGDVTFHGPGQIVGYPILRLANVRCGQDLHKYLRDIEEVLIRTLDEFGLGAERDDAGTGVWIDGRKIAAIGVKCSRWVTLHGFALNHETDLEWFRHIVPCGLSLPVTSMRQELAELCPEREAAEETLRRNFERVFEVGLA